MKPQSRSLPRFSGHFSGSLTSATSSSPPASNSRTLTSGISARRRAITEPDDPEPQTMKSYCDLALCLADTRTPRCQSDADDRLVWGAETDNDLTDVGCRIDHRRRRKHGVPGRPDQYAATRRFIHHCHGHRAAPAKTQAAQLHRARVPSLVARALRAW